MQWFPMYVSDFVGATMELSFIERAAYLMLLMVYYEKEEPIPVDRARTYRMVGCETDEQRAACDYVLTKFFELKDDGYHNARAEREIAKWMNIKNSAKKKATKAAASRWQVVDVADAWRAKRAAAPKQVSGVDAADASSNASSNASSMPQAMLQACSKQCSKHAPSNAPSNAQALLDASADKSTLQGATWSYTCNQSEANDSSNVCNDLNDKNKDGSGTNEGVCFKHAPSNASSNAPSMLQAMLEAYPPTPTIDIQPTLRSLTTTQSRFARSRARSASASGPKVIEVGQGDPVVTMPCIGGEAVIRETAVSDWEKTFPAVDVRATLAEMRAWVVANPSRKKSNVPRFVWNWLKREQDKA